MLYTKKLHRVNFEDVFIETKLEKNHYLVGEQINGVVKITGGTREVHLGYLYLYLKSEYVKNPAQPLVRTEVKLDKFVIGQLFHIKAGQTLDIPFSFILPIHTPITYGNGKVFIHTGLDVHAGDDPEDIDYIEVGPSFVQEKLFKALKLLGLQKKRTIYGPKEKIEEFLQIFEFIKEDISGFKLKISFISSNTNEVKVFIQEFSNNLLISEYILTVHNDDLNTKIETKLKQIIKMLKV